jgi:hypothetical protein
MNDIQAPFASYATADAVAELEQRVLRRLNGPIHDFRLLVRDGGLILQGRARTYHAKQLAQHAVMAVTELPIRGNEIDVC